MSVETSARVFGGQFAGPRDRARLSVQIERIRAWALARDWFTLREARENLEQLYAPTLFPESSLSAQVRNLSKPGAGRLRCKKEKRRRQGAHGAGSGVWEYRLRAIPAEISAMPAELHSDEPLAKIMWPATFDRLEAAGYGYTGRAKQCSCGSRTLWFITPRGKWMLFSVRHDTRLVPHHCANSEEFRAAAHTPADSAGAARHSLCALNLGIREKTAMPRSAQRICCIPGCGAACSGRTCAKHAQEDPRRIADRERGSSTARGYGRRHQKWRLLILHRDPLCKIAHFCAGLAPSTIADHVIPLRAGGDWSLENGQGACERCHNWKRSMESRGWG